MLPAGSIVGALYHKLWTQSSAPENGRNYRPKHDELIVIMNKNMLLLHLVAFYFIIIIIIIKTLTFSFRYCI